MGNTCSPDKGKDDKAPVTDMDKQAAVAEAQESGAQPGEKLTQVINAYQAENERLKAKVEEMESKQTEQNEAGKEDQNQLLKELQAMKAMMADRDRALVKSQVQAALFQHVSTMKDAANSAETLKKDTIEKFGKSGRGSAKSKWVTVTLHKGTRTATGFEPGMLRVSYADSENSGQVSTGRVTKVKTAENMHQKWKGRTFAVEAVMDRQPKDLVFACADTDTRDEWVKVFQKGFDSIKQEADSMQEHFSLTLDFKKEKLGIRVEEKVIEESVQAAAAAEPEQEKKDDDIPAPAADDKAGEDKADACADDIPAPAPQEGDAAEAEKQEGAEEPAKDGEPMTSPEDPNAPEPVLKTIRAEPAAEPAPAAAEEPAAEAADEEKEPPCTLVVTAISDQDLLTQGLCESMALIKLNDTKIDGMAYSKQLGMLTGTDKPFTITFSGPKFLKLGQNQLTVFPAILKQLTADESNDAQTAFADIIKDSNFEKELAAAETKEAKNNMITELLSNQHKLQNLLQSVTTHSADL